MTTCFETCPPAKPMTKLVLTEDGCLDTSRLADCPLTARNRERSPFLQLPPEIRNMIYLDVIPSGLIFVGTWFGDLSLSARWYPKSPSKTRLRDVHAWNKIILLNRICRQIYDDVKFLQYELNGFFFHDQIALHLWMQGRLAEQLRRVTRVGIPPDAVNEYLHNSEIIYKEKFVGLRVLYIDAVFLFHMDELHKDRKAFRPSLEQKGEQLLQKEGDEVKIVFYGIKRARRDVQTDWIPCFGSLDEYFALE